MISCYWEYCTQQILSTQYLLTNWNVHLTPRQSFKLTAGQPVKNQLCIFTIYNIFPPSSVSESALKWYQNCGLEVSKWCFDDQIRIRILFDFPKITEYKYEYYSAFQKWPNTNTNIIWLSRNDWIRIQILFNFPQMTEYEYHLASEKSLLFEVWKHIFKYIAEKS